jgi:hypothetical protein
LDHELGLGDRGACPVGQGTSQERLLLALEASLGRSNLADGLLVIGVDSTLVDAHSVDAK